MAPEYRERPLSERFLEQGLYLRAWSPRTVEVYRRALTSFGDTPLTRPGLAAWVVGLRQQGRAIGGVNILTRAVSSYLSWLYAEGHLAEHLCIKCALRPMLNADSD